MADISWLPLASTLLYSVVGVAIFIIALLFVDKLTPFSVTKEIEQDQNTALGIIIGSLIIGLSIIIAAAISG